MLNFSENDVILTKFLVNKWIIFLQTKATTEWFLFQIICFKFEYSLEYYTELTLFF